MYIPNMGGTKLRIPLLGIKLQNAQAKRISKKYLILKVIRTMQRQQGQRLTVIGIFSYFLAESTSDDLTA